MRQAKTVIAAVFCVSLSLLAAKVVAPSPVEGSSPEESNRNALPGLGFLPSSNWPTFSPALSQGVMDEALSEDPELLYLIQANPLLTGGVIPYQIDPISAFIAAGLVLAVQSYRETGQIDAQAILVLLNSTDLYAGVLGAGFAAYSKRRVEQGLAAGARRLAPRFSQEISQKQLARIFGNIMGGLSYTVAIGSGFEYFSQFWKLSTAGNENVSRVSDIVRAERKDVWPVLQNLLNYFADPSVQKRITSSVYNHRILTYEFIAMNVGLYIGILAGGQIVKKLGPQTPSSRREIWKRRLTDYFGRVLGGVTGGLMVQFTPEFIKISVNEALLEYKINRNLRHLETRLSRLENGILGPKPMYPPEHRANLGSFLFQEMNLQSDLDRLARTLDMLDSLWIHHYLVASDEHLESLDRLLDARAEALHRVDRLFQSIDDRQWMEPQDGEDAERKMWKELHRPLYVSHYGAVLSAAIDRFSREFEAKVNFVDHIIDFRAQADR